MDPLLINAASGMRARMESLEMLSNNLANVSTGGFKMDHEFYSLYAADEAFPQGFGPDPDRQPLIEKPWTDFSQGALRQTGNSLDVALDGSGFLAANGPSGILYTRNGSLKLSPAGVLTTADGYPLRTASGGTVQTTSNAPLEIDRDGTVRQDGQDLGQLALADFPDRNAIDKRGLNYFINVDPKLKAAISKAEVRQGHLEDSNVGAAESTVRLVSVMRQFEALQKAINIGAEMNKAGDELARVGQ